MSCSIICFIATTNARVHMFYRSGKLSKGRCVLEMRDTSKCQDRLVSKQDVRRITIKCIRPLDANL